MRIIIQILIDEDSAETASELAISKVASTERSHWLKRYPNYCSDNPLVSLRLTIAKSLRFPSGLSIPSPSLDLYAYNNQRQVDTRSNGRG